MACAFLIYQGKHDAIAGSVPLEAAGNGEAGVAHADFDHTI